MLWEHEPEASVSTAFRVLPNFHECFYNSIETQYMFSPANADVFPAVENNIGEPEPGNDFREVGILSPSQFSSRSPRTTVRGIRCEEHSSFILSWNLIGQRETKVITSQKSFPGSGSQTFIFRRNQVTAGNTSAFAGENMYCVSIEL